MDLCVGISRGINFASIARVHVGIAVFILQPLLVTQVGTQGAYAWQI